MHIYKSKIVLKRLQNSLLVKNSIYTFTIQFFNYIVPLLLIPYLTRTLGQDGFGKVAFAQSFVM
ncbi:MAG: oligosaccharide flippase family protein, partial [Ignavibacterium sp.]|nr:oligosaccharide flippase family protein [Ignavibacterium sp.]MDW8374841.1 oligosaccharide flippase family protein [Ignavibacteriales bacterium]